MWFTDLLIWQHDSECLKASFITNSSSLVSYNFICKTQTCLSCPQMVPFAGTIVGGLAPGEMVLIQGSVPSGADRWEHHLSDCVCVFTTLQTALKVFTSHTFNISLPVVLQVPGGSDMRQQREAEGRRGVSLEPEVSEVTVHRVQHASEGALGPRGDPAPDALHCGRNIWTHHPRPDWQVQGESPAGPSRCVYWHHVEIESVKAGENRK